jgi:hypothetical protein
MRPNKAHEPVSFTLLRHGVEIVPFHNLQGMRWRLAVDGQHIRNCATLRQAKETSVELIKSWYDL